MPNSGLETMVDLDRIEDLHRLYKLYARVPQGLPIVKRALKASILQRGQQINLTSSGESLLEPVVVDFEEPTAKSKVKPRPNASQTVATALRWVEDVLLLKDKFDAIETAAFGGDRELESSINEVSSRSWC